MASTEPATASAAGQVRRLVVVSSGISQPSSTRLLADRIAAATTAGLRQAGMEPETHVVEVRDHAQDLVNGVLTRFPSPQLQTVIEAVRRADGMIAATPIFTGSYSGLFKLFFDVMDRDSLAGMPVLVAATGGSARHSLALDHALRPLFAYLGALVLPTGVYAASEDWGAGSTVSEAALAERIERAGRELADMMVARQRPAPRDPFDDPVPFDQLLAPPVTPPASGRNDG